MVKQRFSKTRSILNTLNRGGKRAEAGAVAFLAVVTAITAVIDVISPPSDKEA